MCLSCFHFGASQPEKRGQRPNQGGGPPLFHFCIPHSFVKKGKFPLLLVSHLVHMSSSPHPHPDKLST